MATNQKKKSPTETILKEIGEKFQVERLTQGKSLQDVQAKSGVSYISISQIERGLAKNAVLSKLQAIASSLGLDLTFSLTKLSTKKKAG